MNEYAPWADKLPSLDVADQVANISDIMVAVREQVGPSGEWLNNDLVHIEGQLDSELRADDHSSRFTDADDFWKNGMDPSRANPSRANPSQDGSDTSEKLPSKFVNNFWQYFFPDEMFIKDDLLGPTVLNKPPRKLLKEAGGELLASVQRLFGMLFENANIDVTNLLPWSQQLVRSTLPILRRQCLYFMSWHYIRLLNKMLLRLSAQVRMSICANRSSVW